MSVARRPGGDARPPWFNAAMIRSSRLLFVLAAAFIALLAAVPTAAHEMTGGNLVTTVDHLDPGTPFTVLGSELDAGAPLTFWLVTETNSWPLGETQVAQDGTLSATFDVPDDIPLGDAWLFGKTPAGGTLELYVHVGPRAVSPDATGSAFDMLPAVDERTIGLVLLGGGLVVFVSAGGLYLRGRSRAASSLD
jgi:hypothetical protein